MRLENGTKLRSLSVYDLLTPVPSWQRLGNDFYAYSSYWQKNEFQAGGIGIAVVVGMEHSIVNFKCQVQYSDNNMITGKLLFLRVEQPTGPKDKSQIEPFFIYKFLCKVNRDFGAPQNLVFTEMKTSVKHYLPLRALDSKMIKQKMTMTACVDMNNYGHTRDEFSKDTAILQYFLHHQIIGIEEFLVYNGNGLNMNLLNLLNSHAIKVNVLPYNFPFELVSRQQNRAIIEIDCLLRNLNAAKYTMITSVNEFVYPNSRLKGNNQFIRLINKMSSDVNRFRIASRSVVLDYRKKIFSDNFKYDVEAKDDLPFYIYRPVDYNRTDDTKSIDIDRNIIFVHKYIENKTSNKNDLYEWTSIVDDEFKAFINDIAKELNRLLFT